MSVSIKENREKEDLEDANAGEIGCPPASPAWLEGGPDAHDGGRAPGTLQHVIVRGIVEREGYFCPEICSPQELLEVD